VDNETEIGKKVQESGVMSKGKPHRSWYGAVDGGQSWTCNIFGYDTFVASADVFGDVFVNGRPIVFGEYI